jgi:hypothetical protein
MTAPPLAGLSSYAAAARAEGSVEEAVRFYERILAEDQALDRSEWWSDFYAVVRQQST